MSDRREGVEKGILRVYIRDELSDSEGTEPKNEKILWNEISQKGRDRAIHLIISYIRSITSDPQKYSIFDEKILKAVENGTMVFKDCTDEYCEAFIDYQVKELIDNIDSSIKSEKTGK